MDQLPPFVRALWDPNLRPWLQTRAADPRGVAATNHSHSGPDTHAVVALAHAPAVTIADIGDVLRHDVVRIARSTSHTVRFVGGGVLRYAYNDRGELIELSTQHLRVLARGDGRVVVESLDDGATDPATALRSARA